MSWLSRVFRGDTRAPRDVDAALREALLAVLDRDWDRAEELLVGAARSDPDGLAAWLALARLFRRRGEIGRAIRIHQNLLLRLDPASPGGRAALADLAADFRQGGFLRRAIASYEELLQQEPKHREALRALARLLAEAREFERAIEVTRRLARVEGTPAGPAEAALRVQMAEAAQAEGRSDAARKAVKQALRKDKRCVRAWILRGGLEAERGNAKAALAAWARVPKLDARSGPQVYPQLEATYASLDRARDYESLLRKLLEDRPEDAGVGLALARHLAARGEADEALKQMRAILERDPDDVVVRSALGRLLLSEHRDEEASREHAELLDVLDRRGLAPAREAFE